jgi:hypothetical protein
LWRKNKTPDWVIFDVADRSNARLGGPRKVDYPLLERQPNVNSTVPATGTASVPGRRKKSIMASGGCVRVVMTISIGISAWAVAIFTSVLVSFGCPIFVPMLIRALLAMLVSMFILAVLRVKAQWSQANDRKCAEGQYNGFQVMLHYGESLLVSVRGSDV